MNSLGLNLIFRSGCPCSKDTVRINGKTYYIRDRLGTGGFSVVELVENSATHELFALKKIICHSPEDQRIALSEVEVHRRVQHSNVLDVVDYDLRGKSDPLIDSTSQVLILLPYHQRGTLAAELERREKKRAFLEEKEVLRLFRIICEAVVAFHTCVPPLAHRDLKTTNILLDDNFNPIIMDLGSAASARVEVTNITQARLLEETAAERSSMPYRAPELFNIPSQTHIDERTDVWSLGCVLYALCFFKSPYDIVYERGDSVNLSIVSGRLDFPQDSPFSQELHDFIRSILIVDPKERPFIQDLLKVKQLEAKAQGCV